MQWNIYSGRFSPYCQMIQHERNFSQAVVENIRSYSENTPWKETNHFSRENSCGLSYGKNFGPFILASMDGYLQKGQRLWVCLMSIPQQVSPVISLIKNVSQFSQSKYNVGSVPSCIILCHYINVENHLDNSC